MTSDLRGSRAGSRPLPVFATACLCAFLSLVTSPLAAQGSEDRLRALEKEVAAVRAEIARLAAASPAARAPAAPEVVPETAAAKPAPAVSAPDLAEVARRVELLAGEIEKLKLGEVAVAADTADQGLGPAASKVYRTPQGLSIGGYGEMVYQAFDGTSYSNVATVTIDVTPGVEGPLWY